MSYRSLRGTALPLSSQMLRLWFLALGYDISCLYFVVVYDDIGRVVNNIVLFRLYHRGTTVQIIYDSFFTAKFPTCYGRPVVFKETPLHRHYSM